jgi:L-gulonate 3-dehydrogenase
VSHCTTERPPETIAIVGAGVVGRGWVPVFARSGHEIRIHDPSPGQLESARDWIESFLLSSPAVRGHSPKLRFCAHLEEALQGATYVQESIQENLIAKRDLFERLDRLCEAGTLLCSSTSSLDINDIATSTAHPGRCFTVHPFNPAAVLPVVEILATRAGSGTTTERVAGILRRAGQVPVVLHRFVPGYIGNRLQAALMREALALVDAGVADADAVDALLTHGLALRWVILGVFGTNHTNADHGIREYYERFWGSYRELIGTLAVETPAVEGPMIDAISATLEKRFGNASIPEIARWRDRLVLELRKVQLSTLPPAGTAG